LKLKVVSAFILLCVTYIGAWFQPNAQYVWDWWKEKPFLATVVFGVPCGTLYVYTWSIITESTGSVWSTRFIAFSVSVIVFSLMTHFLLNESMLTLKTTLCNLLSVAIILIQIFMK